MPKTIIIVLTIIFISIFAYTQASGQNVVFEDGFEAPVPTKLIHKWPFNESGGAGTSLVDVVGGANATIINVGVNDASVRNGRVTLQGGERDSSDYISLPDGILSGLTDATIEVWAASNSAKIWSRIFDFGPNESNYLMMTWSIGSDINQDRIQWNFDSAAEVLEDNTMGPYSLGFEHHIVMTIEKGAGTNGKTLLKWYLDGTLKGSAETSKQLTDLGAVNNWLGRSKYPADETADGWYNELRIYDGALSDEEVASSYVQGPEGASGYDAVVYYPGNDRYYIFEGIGYTRQSHGQPPDAGYPYYIPTNWDWPSGWGEGDVDAAVYFTGDSKYYLFKGDEYFRQGHTPPPESGYPRLIATNWVGWPTEWGSGDLDAIMYYPGNGKFYLFKGSEYARHSYGQPPDSGYPRPIVGNWPGWPATWGTGDLDAVVYYPGNEKLYLFKGSKYLSQSFGQPPDSGYPRAIEGNWEPEKPAVKITVNLSGPTSVIAGNTIQMTSTVASNVGSVSQAVTWMSSNTGLATVSSSGLVTGVSPGSVTITASSQIDPTAKATQTVTVNAPVISVELSGLSTVVAGQSLQLSAAVSSTGGAISQGVTWRSSNTAIATVGGTGLVTGVAAGSVTITATSQVATSKSASKLINVSPAPRTASVFDAVVYYPGNEKYYLFKGDQYYRQAHNEILDDGYPLSIASVWDGWPATGWGAGDVDAVVYYPGNSKYYLFKGSQYIRHSHGEPPDAGYPKSIASSWDGWPATGWGTGDVDAVVYYPGNSKYYLFKGSQYIRHSHGEPPDAGYPKSIAGNWDGWPATGWGTGDVDAVVYYPGNSKFYLFKGNEYIRHGFADPPDSGYPRPIEGNWARSARLTAVDLLGDVLALSKSYTVKGWDGMDFPSDFNNRGNKGHIQGVARVGDTWILSHSREDYRGVLIFGTNNNWRFRATVPDLGNHPGGIQASGDVVVVTYKEEKSGIKFFQFDSSGYQELVHLRLDGGKGQAAGLAYHPEEEVYYVIDGSNATFGDSSHQMYKSTKPGAPLTDPTNGWEKITKKMDAYGAQGGMQLMYDEKTKAMYLIAMDRPEGNDVLLQNTHRMDITKLNLENMTGEYWGFRSDFDRTDNVVVDPTFRFGAGLLLDEKTGRVSFIATERCTSYEYAFDNPTNPAGCDLTQDLVDYFILSR